MNNERLDMNSEKIKITDIVPADYNPRLISERDKVKLKNSLSRYGLVDPIVINLKNNHIIGGHQRFDVLLDEYLIDNEKYNELNIIRLGDIGWVFADDDLKIESDDDEKALNLALNKISGEWDYDKLGLVLEEISLDGFDVTLTGFDEIEIEDILFDENDDLDDEVVDRNIEEAFNSIYDGLSENEELNDGKSDNRIISFYTSDEDLYYKFLDYLNLDSIKLDKKRNVKLEDLECLKEPATD